MPDSEVSSDKAPELVRSVSLAWIWGLRDKFTLLLPNLCDTGNVRGGGEKAVERKGKGVVAVRGCDGIMWSSPFWRSPNLRPIFIKWLRTLFTNFATGSCIFFVGGGEVDIDQLVYVRSECLSCAPLYYLGLRFEMEQSWIMRGNSLYTALWACHLSVWLLPWPTNDKIPAWSVMLWPLGVDHGGAQHLLF